MLAGYIFTDFPYISKHGEKKVLKCTTFIVIDKDYGPIIFDTGSVFDQTILTDFLKKEFDLSPLDVKWVFITHIHPDHIGGNRLFRNSNLVISKNDYEFGDKIAQVVFQDNDLLTYLHEHCPGYKYSFEEYEAERMKRQIKEKWSKENIGIDLNVMYIEDSPNIPPFIKIIPTPGHTFFHYSFLLDMNEIKILIAGDALSMRMILRENNEERFIEPHMEFYQYFDSLEKIKKFDGLIVPGHDRPFFPNTLKAIRKNKFDLSELKNLKNSL